MVRVVAHIVALSMWTNSTCEERVPRGSSYTQPLAGLTDDQEPSTQPDSPNCNYPNPNLKSNKKQVLPILVISKPLNSGWLIR